MPRYIDADALKEEISRIYYLHYAKTQDKTISDFFNAVAKRIKGASTVDSEPIKHGRWIYKWFDSYCSVCGWENKADTVTRIRNDYPYCPNCGAKIEGIHQRGCSDD